MTKYFCDRCGKQLDEEDIRYDEIDQLDEGVVVGSIRKVEHNQRKMEGYHYCHVDLCKDCQIKLDLLVSSFMDNRVD